MKKINLFMLILILLFTSVSILVADGNFVIRFNNPDLQIIKTFNYTNYDVAAYKPGEFLDIVVSDVEYQELVAQGYDVVVTQTEEHMKNNLKGLTDLDGYIDYEEMLAELQQIELDYPDICKLYDIGETRGKQYSDAGNSNYDDYYHEVWAMKVSDNVETEEDEPSIYYLSEHHAREPISLEVNMAILNHIIDNYGTDPEITENVDNTQIWFVPLVNPNGHKVVIDEQNVWMRKNICDNNENGVLDVTGYNVVDGVDPNRNYGWEWGGASTDWTSETYQGPNAFSEPETQAVRDLFAEHHFLAGLTYHSYGELILYPYGYAYGVIAPDQAALSELCTDMALSIPGQSGGFYTPEAGWELYPATGTTDDYAYGTYGIFEYTVELATQFIPPAGQVEGICEDNIEAAMILLDRVNGSILTGHITDADTDDPIEAMTFIDGIDDTGAYREPYMSNEEFGRYYRLLTNGSYDVTFSAYGYDSQTFEDVVINDDITSLDIELVPSSSTIDLSGVVTDGDTGEPVSYATVAIQDFGISPVTTNENGEYTIEDLYEFNYTIAVYSSDHAGIIEQNLVTASNNVIDFELYAMPDGTFEDGEFASSWNFSGNNNWVIDDVTVYSGNYSAKSGSIYHDQTSSLSISLYIQEDDEISFYQKVSSETDYDYLRFYIDNELQDSWSGYGGWELETFDVELGFHTFTWEYYKDGGVSSYQDCGWIDQITFPTSSVAVTPNENGVPANVRFNGNYPNPFNPTTTFSYSLGGETNVTLTLYNIKGQKIKTLIDENQTSGTHQVIWDGTDNHGKKVSTGIYFSHFDASEKEKDYTSVKKIILLK